MPLTFAEPGEANIVKRVGGNDEVRKHLADLGFVVGSVVAVVTSMNGNVIVNVKDSRIAISEEMARRIMVRFLCKKERKMKTLRETKIGETVTVKKLTGEGPVKRRIMDMGVTKGVEIYVRKVAPLGDPVEVTIRGYELSLRKEDAEMIVVE